MASTEKINLKLASILCVIDIRDIVSMKKAKNKYSLMINRNHECNT